MHASLPIVALALAANALPAQVPAGHFVTCSHFYQGADGGLAIVHPTIPGAATVVSGLSDQLTGAGTTLTYKGCNSIAYSDDGFLLVGEIDGVGEVIDIHEIFVVDGIALVDFVTPVGIGAAGSVGSPSIVQIAALANGDAIFVTSNLTNAPPLNGSQFGYFDRSLRVVTPIAIPFTQLINGMAVDEEAGLIYFGAWSPRALMSAPIGGGAPVQIAPLTTSVYNMSVDEAGNILIATGQTITTYDSQTGQPLLVETFPAFTNGVSIERTTATTVAVAVSSSSPHAICRFDPTGATVLATNAPGFVSGITVANSVVEYGTATPGATEYAIRTFPGVGGLPIAGSQSHALQVDAADGSAPIGVLAISFGATSLPALGVQILVDPGTAITFGPFVTGTPISFPIPVGLPSTTVFLQSLHLDAANPGGFAATRGIRLTTVE